MTFPQKQSEFAEYASIENEIGSKLKTDTRNSVEIADSVHDRNSAARRPTHLTKHT